MQPDCRIRRLKIRSTDRVGVPRFCFMLEDALRTASFPGLPPNGVVFIRTLDLGPLNLPISSRKLSCKIDQWIQTIRPVPAQDKAVPPDDAPAVWFADELAPYRLLAERLASGHRPKAWFWQTAVKGWSPCRPLLQNFEEIMGHVARMTTGIVGLAHVLAPLREKEILLDLLAVCKPERLCEVLFFSGLTMRPSPATGHLPVASGGARLRNTDDCGPLRLQGPPPLVAKAVHRWGFAAPATRVIAALELAFNALSVNDRSVDQILTEVAAQNQPRPVRSRREPRHETTAADHGHDSQKSSAEIDGDTVRREVETSDQRSPRIVEANAPSVGTRLGRKDNAQTGALHAIRCKGPAAPQRRSASIASAVEDRYTTGEDQRDHSDVVIPEQVYPCFAVTGRFSRFAGFPLLINVLARIGIEAIFQDLPESPSEIAMAALRQAVLWRIAGWQKISLDDPAPQFLGDPQEIFDSLEKSSYSITPKAILERAPGNRRDLFSPPQSRNPSCELCIGQLIDVLVLAVCRYVHRYARMTVPRMIRRPALIAITPTHMDITAALATLDTRLRMAGLDVDPGWVPWLKRVIRLHYSDDRN